MNDHSPPPEISNAPSDPLATAVDFWHHHPSDRFAWWSWPQRVVLLVMGVAAPAVFGAMLLANNPGPYQPPGNTSDYAWLLLTWKPFLPFLPFFLFSMICFPLAVARPERFAEQNTIRRGVYLGVCLAVHFCGVLVVAMGPDEAMVYLILASLAVAISLASIQAIGWLARWFRDHSNGTIGIILIFPIIWFGVPLFVFLLLPMTFVFGGPLAALAYTMVGVRIARERREKRFQFSLAWLFGLVTLVAVYLAAWRWSILIMLEEYAKLTTM
ncbi:MAG: hypothetical protein JW809_05365 [Pirellulales bacterium]|nr:hypothetical protein [Pirellulales bacterium]